jgi:hypothetical protein
VPHKPLWQRVARKTQIGRRARNFLWAAKDQKLEGIVRSEEGRAMGFDRPIDDKAFNWERQQFTHFAVLCRGDGVLPVLVSQAGLASLESIEQEEIRSLLDAACYYVKMGAPILVDTWFKVSEIIKEVAEQYDAVFVDGYNAVPHDLKYFQDHVHLHDAGAILLGKRIASVLLEDERFRSLAERVRNEATSD